MPGHIHISPSTHELLKKDYRFTPVEVEVKGKGTMLTYNLEARITPMTPAM